MTAAGRVRQDRIGQGRAGAEPPRQGRALQRAHDRTAHDMAGQSGAGQGAGGEKEGGAGRDGAGQGRARG